MVNLFSQKPSNSQSDIDLLKSQLSELRQKYDALNNVITKETTYLYSDIDTIKKELNKPIPKQEIKPSKNYIENNKQGDWRLALNNGDISRYGVDYYEQDKTVHIGLDNISIKNDLCDIVLGKDFKLEINNKELFRFDGSLKFDSEIVLNEKLSSNSDVSLSGDNFDVLCHRITLANQYGEIIIDGNNGLSLKGSSLILASINDAPKTPNDTGTKNEVRYDGDYIYRCVEQNKWVRFKKDNLWEPVIKKTSKNDVLTNDVDIIVCNNNLDITLDVQKLSPSKVIKIIAHGNGKVFVKSDLKISYEDNTHDYIQKGIAEIIHSHDEIFIKGTKPASFVNAHFCVSGDKELTRYIVTEDSSINFVASFCSIGKLPEQDVEVSLKKGGVEFCKIKIDTKGNTKFEQNGVKFKSGDILTMYSEHNVENLAIVLKFDS